MIGSRTRRSGNVAVGVVSALVAVLFTPTEASAAAGTTARVSVAGDGAQGDGFSYGAAISADGRYVAFASQATNLVPGDTNNTSDVFVRDIRTGITTRVSLTVDGTQAGQRDRGSDQPAISADGRYVAFQSSAADLVPGDNNRSSDIFVRDRQTGTTERVSVNNVGSESNQGSEQPAISADGRYVAFVGGGNNLVCRPLDVAPLPPRCDPTVSDTNNRFDIFVRDRQSGTTTRVSVANDGSQGNGNSQKPAISADGRYVAFWSEANGLVDGDTVWRDIFVHDRQTAATTRVSVANDGAEGNGDSVSPDISADGRYVAFSSEASNLVDGDTNNAIDTFVHDRQTAATTRVSVTDSGGQATGQGELFHSPGISADGRFVTVATDATNLVPDDTDGDYDVFVRDRQATTTTLVSVAGDGTHGNGNSTGGRISADGRTVAFDSSASNLVAGDTNDAKDVFVRDTSLPTVVSVGDVTIHEGDAGSRTAVLTVSLSKPSPAPVTVAYATINGTATGSDFTAKTGTLSFAPGSTSATVKVPVAGDTTDELDESFTVALSSPTGAVIGDGTGAGNILDDEPATVAGRRVAIGDVVVHEGDLGARAAVFTVSLSKASASYAKVSFATAKGSAVGTDFTATSGTLSFAPGVTTMSVKVAITPDTTVEGDESFTVKLGTASGATISDATGLGTIVNND